MTFYNFLKIDYINKLSDSFTKTINDLIPYYQNMMHLLSSQQQKIIQYLCQVRTPSNVKNISENCFSTQSTISKQINTLLKLKYVDAQSKGRETYYELSEPFLRICTEVKENRGGPIKLFIDFLGNLYTVDEIKKKYMHFHILSKMPDYQITTDCFIEQHYLKETLKQYYPDVYNDGSITELERGNIEFQINSYIEELKKTKAYKDILDFTAKLKEKNKNILIEEALVYDKMGDIEKEIQTAKLVLINNENDIDALLLLAEVYLKKEEYIESEKYFKKVLILENNNLRALNGLAANLFFIGNFIEAEKIHDKMLSLKTNQDSRNITLIMRCLVQIILGKYKDARSNLMKLHETDKYRATVIKFLGIISIKQNNYHDANNYFKELTKLEPNNSEAWELLGNSHEILDKIEAAQKSYLKALDLDDNNIDVLYNLGLIYGNQADHKKAYDCFKKLTKLQPNLSVGWQLLGDSQINLNKMDEAKTSYLKALQLDDKNAEAIKSLSILFCRIGEHNNALIYSSKLTELQPDISEAWYLLGLTQMSLLKFEDAKNSFLRALELKSNNFSVLRIIGILLYTEKKFDQSMIYIDKALNINKNDSNLLNTKGEIFRLTNEFEKAIPIYQYAVKIDKNYYNPYFNILSCYLGLNDIPNALSQIKKSLSKAKKLKISDELIEPFEENYSTLYMHASKNNIEQYFEESLKLIEINMYSDQFYASIPGTIFELLRQHEKINTERFEFIEQFLKEKFKENEEMIMPLHFLNVGIRHFKKKEKNALFLFTKEERATFEKFVLDKIKNQENSIE